MIKRVMTFGVLMVVLAMAMVLPFSCATVGKDGGTDSEKMDRVISTIQGIEHSLKWVAPIACGVIAVAMDPAAAAACRVAQTALDALVVTTDQVVSNYQGNPSSENAQHVTDILGRLQDAWKVMDAAYKGDASKLKTQDKQSCLHPSAWKRILPRVFPLSFGPTSAQAADCKFSWKAVAGSTSYALEYTSDNGATWVGKKNTGALTPDANGDVAYTYAGVPETGLMLFRVSALNATGSATRTEYGAWYNHLWKPMAAPTGGGITNN